MYHGNGCMRINRGSVGSNVCYVIHPEAVYRGPVSRQRWATAAMSCGKVTSQPHHKHKNRKLSIAGSR
jgi:hypothetical protein